MENDELIDKKNYLNRYIPLEIDKRRNNFID